MKTLWIISELFPPDETSTAYILGELANAAAKEYEVRVICGPEVYDKRKKIDKEHPFILDGSIQVYHVTGAGIDKNKSWQKTLSFLLMSTRLYKAAKKMIDERDKVLLVTNPAPLVLLMSRLRKNRTFELNVLVHDVFPENMIPAGMNLPGWAYKWLKRRFDKAYSRVDRFITLGRDMAEVVSKKAGDKAKVEIVENWADVDIVKPLPFPKGKIKLEYAGNIGRVQGLEKIMRELPEELELHFYGTGSMEEALKEMNHPNVYFHGAYFRSQQTEVLGACHAAIVTLSEGMYGLGVPSKSYNIMAAGRPIIYFGPADGEIALMIKERGIGYIGWPEKWDRAELEEMGRKARVLAETKYSKEAILNKFVNVTQDIDMEDKKVVSIDNSMMAAATAGGGTLLFTGGSGFLGYNIRPLLERQYDVVHTIGIGETDDLKYNLAKEVPPINTHYDVVLHAAGKAHTVPQTEEEKQVFFDVNYQGTVNLCKALENAGVPKAIVFISTVAVYGCEYGELITEEHPLEGDSPYAKSKIMAEEYLTNWCKEHNVTLGILRPSLLAGKRAPGNLGAMVNGVRKGFYLNIAGGKVKKSILMAEDIAKLLPLLAKKGGIYNVCDTYQPTFGELSASVAKQLGKHKPISIPYWMAWCMAKVGDLLGDKAPINSYKLEKMTKSLTFSNEKARKELGWEPLDVLTNYKIE